MNFRVGKRTNWNLGVYLQSHVILWASNVKAPISLAKPGIKPSGLRLRHKRFPYFLNVPGLATIRIDLYRCELISNWDYANLSQHWSNFPKNLRCSGGTTIHTLAVQGVPCQRVGAVMGNSRIFSNKFARMGIGPVAQKRTSPLQWQARNSIKLHQEWFFKAIVVGRKIASVTYL